MRSRKIIPLLLLAFGFFSLGTASLILLNPGKASSSTIEYEPSTACVEPMLVEYNAPSIELRDLGQNIVAIDDYQGDIVLLNTWASWCPPCRAEMPDLQAFFDKYKGAGFTLIGVNIGEAQDQVLDFALENNLTFPLWLDPDERTLRALNTISLPYSVVIDRDGIVRYAWSGATCEDALERNIAPLIIQ